jgi:hypothetical protein
MGILGNLLKRAMLTDPDYRHAWELIQKLREQGDHSEADRKEKELEETLHKVFGHEDEETKEDA